MKDGEEEKKYRTNLLISMQVIFSLIRKSMQQERELLAELLPIKRQKVTHNNNNQ